VVAAVEVEDLYFYYTRGEYVLRGVTFTVELGESVAIMGSNGAGKTTLVKHLNGLLKPVRGVVRVLGMDTREHSVAELARHVGVVFQNPDHQLFAETVEEEVRFALENFGFPEDEIGERVEWALAEFGLERYRKASPFSLSEGEKKRLAIASVVVYEPDVLVLDEPTVGQDAIQRERIAEMLREFMRRGRTVIVVSHDVEFVAELFDRVIVMSRGRVVADGSARSVLTDPAVLSEARLALPQVAECARRLSDLGVPRDLVRLEELEEHLLRVVGV